MPRFTPQERGSSEAQGVKRVCIPNRSTKSRRKREQRKRWFRSGQKWRTGCEGRISVAKRRHHQPMPIQGVTPE
jgi:IS5 family transposase